MIHSLIHRCKQGLKKVLGDYRPVYERYVLGPVTARSGLLARRLRWPWPDGLPWQRRVLHVARGGAMGDVLMCTPALRRVKELNPACRVVFFTYYPELLPGLPFLDEA